MHTHFLLSSYKNVYVCRFDYQFLLGGLLEEKIKPRNLIIRGQKIINLELTQNRIRFWDSLLYIPATTLRAFPALFGLSCGVKGNFPHGLNTDCWVKWPPEADLAYEETDKHGICHYFPPLHYFHPENLSRADLKELQSWHQSQVPLYGPNLKRYMVRSELISYCSQDTTVLRTGFEAFRQQLLTQYPRCELLASLTLPSHNNKLWRLI